MGQVNTPCSGAPRSFAPFLRHLKATGYRVAIYCFSLANAQLAVRRVRLRVSLGGHDVPAEVVRRRFDRSRANFLSSTLRWLMNGHFLTTRTAKPRCALQNATQTTLSSTSRAYGTESNPQTSGRQPDSSAASDGGSAAQISSPRPATGRRVRQDRSGGRATRSSYPQKAREAGRLSANPPTGSTAKPKESGNRMKGS